MVFLLAQLTKGFCGTLVRGTESLLTFNSQEKTPISFITFISFITMNMIDQ